VLPIVIGNIEPAFGLQFIPVRAAAAVAATSSILLTMMEVIS
jgi:hypothetical protein